MLKIQEKLPTKIPGLTSLYLSFPFNQQIIDTIKQSGAYQYNKKDYTWELPVSSLAFLLDELTYVTDIELQLMQEEEKEVLKPILIENYKLKPFTYQERAIEYGLNNPKNLLLLAPGLGKSMISIHIAEELKAQKGLQHCLVICGINTLKQNWKKEIQAHSDLSCRIIGEKISRNGTVSYASVKERAAELQEPLDAFFYILNIESLRSEDVINAILKSKNKIDMIIFDEVHRCNNPASQQSHGLMKLKDFTYKIGMTGTILTNSPLNAYLPLKWIDVEHSNLTTFKNQYCLFGGFGGYEIVGYKNIEMLKDELATCSLRISKDELNLPPKTVIEEEIELSDEHRKFYDAIKKGVKEEADKIELKSNNILALTTRLRQATAAPNVLTTQTIMSSKIERAVELAEDIISQGEKVVIMSTFKESLYQLETLLKQYNPVIANGDIKDDIVSHNIDMFQQDNIHKVFLGTHSKAGTGITLNRAKYLILIDTPWTDALTQQVEDRIHRVTNTEPVFIYRLICKDTIDELVAKIVRKKKATSDFIVDDKVDEDTLDVLREYIEGL